MADAEPYALRYERWVRAYARELYSFAARLAGNHQAAEDLVQETFSEAWRSIAKQREPEKARAWLFQILRYRYAHWVDAAQRSRHVVRLPDEPDEHPPARERNPADGIADRDAIQVGLDQLSADIRITFLMAVVENLPCREVAEQLGIPLGTVLSRLESARRTLRAALATSDPGIRARSPKPITKLLI